MALKQVIQEDTTSVITNTGERTKWGQKKMHSSYQVLTQVAKQPSKSSRTCLTVYQVLSTSISMACMWILRGLRQFIASMTTMGLSQVISSPTNLGGYTLDLISRCDYLEERKQQFTFS